MKGLAGPAKWAAVSLVSALAGAGLTYSLVTRGPSPVVVERPAGASGALRPAVSAAEPAPRPLWMPGGPLEPQTQANEPGAGGNASGDEAAPAEPARHDPEPVRPAHAPPKRVNINTATQAELELLPGIGPSMAKAILDHRRAQGPFRSIADLDKVRGIGPRTLERLAPLITVD